MLATRRASVGRARTWGLAVDITSLDDVVLATGWYDSAQRRLGTATPIDPVSPHGGHRNAVAAEAVMHRLLLAAQHDDLAARVVLQRLLPGLITRARRWTRRHDGDALADVVAAAWTVIRTYPLARRPHHLVANLLNDSEYHAFRRAGRRMLQQVPVEHRHLDLPVEHVAHEPLRELADVVSCARSLCDADRRLLSLLLSGSSTLEMAATLEVSERTVRNHRAHLVEVLRDTIEQAAAA